MLLKYLNNVYIPYSFGGGEHHMVDKVNVLGNFYARVYDNGEIEYFIDTEF